jgi:hypothetical protein
MGCLQQIGGGWYVGRLEHIGDGMCGLSRSYGGWYVGCVTQEAFERW